jgi:hypothetical protein
VFKNQNPEFLEIGRTKLKPTPEEAPNRFCTASKPRLEALFTGKKCTTLIKFLNQFFDSTQKIMIT